MANPFDPYGGGYSPADYSPPAPPLIPQPQPGDGNDVRTLRRALELLQTPFNRGGLARSNALGRAMEMPILAVASVPPAGPFPFTWVFEGQLETDDTGTLIIDVQPPPLKQGVPISQQALTGNNFALYCTIPAKRGDGATTQDAVTSLGSNFGFLEYVQAWGKCIPFVSGRVNVAAMPVDFTVGAKLAGGVVKVSVSLAPGLPVTAWEPDVESFPFFTLGANATADIDPVRYARRVQISVLTGAITTPTAVAAGNSVILAANNWTVTAGPAGASVSVEWETCRAT